jgi:hypothetical protein
MVWNMWRDGAIRYSDVSNTAIDYVGDGAIKYCDVGDMATAYAVRGNKGGT